MDCEGRGIVSEAIVICCVVSALSPFDLSFSHSLSFFLSFCFCGDGEEAERASVAFSSSLAILLRRFGFS